jgi:hypothetical protein
MKVNKLKPPAGKNKRLDIANFLLAKVAIDDNEWQRGGDDNGSDVDDEDEQSESNSSGDEEENDAEESESDEDSFANESESEENPVDGEDDEDDNKKSLLRTPSTALRAMDSIMASFEAYADARPK